MPGRVLQWTSVLSFPQQLWAWLACTAFAVRLTVCSLCYNEFLDFYYAIDTCLEPLFWFIDHFTKVLGPLFVGVVFLLTLSIIIIAYVIGLPYWLHHSPLIAAVALVVGHWILLNVLFHYYMAFATSPGGPPQGALIPEAVSICKKCIAPKPPRAHHCSVCNKCILKMDHHCPWLDNCIGHGNHRYFFLYCVYMWLGANFVMAFGFHIAQEHFFPEDEQVTSNSTISSITFGNKIEDTYNTTGESHNKNDWSLLDTEGKLYHTCLVYAALICIGVSLALGALSSWHARLITRGETSIEAHINKKEAQRYKQEGRVYKNPYDFGPRKNWRLFLGLTHGRGWLSVLLPTNHSPEGDGLRWHTLTADHWAWKELPSSS